MHIYIHDSDINRALTLLVGDPACNLFNHEKATEAQPLLT